MVKTFRAQAAWFCEDDGEEHEDVEDFATLAEARAWLDHYHAGRAMREIWEDVNGRVRQVEG
jgi:hypothetical protein